MCDDEIVDPPPPYPSPRRFRRIRIHRDECTPLLPTHSPTAFLNDTPHENPSYLAGLLSLVHLLIINFPFALVAWLYIFVFTLAGTALLITLPIGCLLCFLNVLGARMFASAELALQKRFHGQGVCEGERVVIFKREGSFYRDTYAMFASPQSYHAIFYFLVIKPALTLSIFLGLLVVSPIVLLPPVLRRVHRLGVWQAGVAVEGLVLAP